MQAVKPFLFPKVVCRPLEKDTAIVQKGTKTNIPSRRCPVSIQDIGTQCLARLNGAVKGARLNKTQRDLANSALKKMTRGRDALAGADGLDSAVAKVMAEQCKNDDKQISNAKAAVKEHFHRLRQQALKQLDEIKKRMEAKEDAGYWNKLTKVLQVVGASAMAASSIFTGPLGIAAASMLIASMVVAETVPGETGQYLSLGLGIGAALCGGVSGFVGEAANSTATATLARVGASAQMGAAASNVCQAYYDKQAINAEANLAEIRAQCKQLMARAEDERETLQLVLEAQTKGLDIALKAMNSNHQAAKAAIH